MIANRTCRAILACLGIGLAAVFLSGCGDEAASIAGTAPVTGKVTYQGQPVADASVSFVGEAEGLRTAVGRTGADGVYTLRTLETAGAMPGKYTVLVTKTETAAGSDAAVSMDDATKNKAASAEPNQLLPAKYGDAAQSPLKFEVKSGANTIDLTLED